MLQQETCWDATVAELKHHIRGALRCLKPKHISHFTEEHLRLISLGFVASLEDEVCFHVEPGCGQCDFMIRDHKRGVFLLVKFHCESVEIARDRNGYADLSLTLDQLLTLRAGDGEFILAECVTRRQQEVATACRSLLRESEFDTDLAYAVVILCVGRRLESDHVTPIVC